ncbi:MAG: signal transduction histidine kinase [Clostridia bacterium]|jgi:signal transduction histidine kinase|nr:signal transduction histidine kinase [Clostridia bacterium]
MDEKLNDFYFGMMKLIFLSLMIIYFIISKDSVLTQNQFGQISLLLILISILIAYELAHKLKIILLGIAAGLTMFVIYLFGDMYFLLIPIIILDAITFFNLNSKIYLTSVLGILGCSNKLLYFLICLFLAGLYYQHYFVIQKYRDYVNILLSRERSLQKTIDRQDLRYQGDIEKFALVYENEKLEEKSKLSQALHDKIGHSINGSIFQLEACRLLVDKKPDQTKEKLQDVIDTLRASMDEIRMILRREKPQMGEIKYVQLKKLCTDFRTKYNIAVDFKCEGEASCLSEAIWELLLDNTIEAFSNALKYSGCDTIAIHIFIFNKLLRCTIKDNGKGCKSINDGMGLSGMKERIKSLGGTIDISSEIGFQINMLLPIGEDVKLG